jgi:predicted molibdopterin-dependent oxidoreductase YjgC
MTNSMDDIADHAQAILIIGSNTTEQHPVFGAKIRQAVLKRGAKLVVIDPRATDITEHATLHLRPRSGTDIALLNGLMHIILQHGWENRAFIADRTENFAAFQENLAAYPPEEVSKITGIPVDQMHQAAEILATSKPTAVLYAMGVTQHTVGVQNVLTVANLQMLLGNLGIPGGGVNPLRGQNNVQGACDMGGLPNVYPAYQPVTNEAARKKFESAWGVPLPEQIGLTATQMIPMAGTGEVKALYIMAENPIMSDPDTNHVRHCLETCEFIVLQEIFPSETSAYADVLLPGVTFAEKSGTFTNTERRVQRVRQAIDPLGDARPDWQIIRDIARGVIALGSRKPAAAPFSAWDYGSAEDVMPEINALAPSYAGVSYERLENGERLQWPVPSLDHPGTPILHRERFTRGLGQFMPTNHIEPAERPNDEYPLLLNTGRVLYHWHGGEMTRRAKGLMEIYGRPLAELNPEDAARQGIRTGDCMQVASRRGKIQVTAWVTERVPVGMIYAGFHFPEASVNELTIAALDPVAKIPEFKVSAVKITRVDQ